MDKDVVQKALKELNTLPQRKFSQSYDLIINLKNFDVKKQPLDFFATLHYSRGKKIRIAAFVDQQLAEDAEKNCDLVIQEKDFERYKDTKQGRKLAKSYDYFIAQTNLMPKVAAIFGKSLGVRGKMPNPKLGCVVPGTAALAPLTERLKKSVHLSAKKGLNLQALVGKQDQAEAEVIDNILTVYGIAVKQLPNENQNIKSVQLKLTMSKPVTV